MSFNYNQVTLVGRLTKDPEYKRISDTFSKLTFTLAVGRPRRKGDEPETDFIPVELYNYSATMGRDLLKKGTPTLIWGRIRVRSYDKNGETRWITEVQGDNFQILERLLAASEEIASQEEAITA